MAIKKYKPTSPGRRNSSVSDYAELTRSKPEKSLLEKVRKTGGRNHHGKITCRHIGGGNKRRYRRIDFKRDKDECTGTVFSIEYDPYRTCHIALLHYTDGEKRYILAPNGLKKGDTVVSGERVEPKVGNCMPLANIPVGMDVHNVELHPGQGGKMVRAAGASARLGAKEGGHAHLLMPSGETRKVSLMCRATLGQIGNIEYQNIRWGKAGRMRHRGVRPTVRGSAMNPVAHPMGGGEGRRAGGRHPVSPTGVLAKGGKTRNPRKGTSKMIIRRRKTNRGVQVML